MYHFRVRKTRIGSEAVVTGFSRLSFPIFILYYFIKCDEEKGISGVPIPREWIYLRTKGSLRNQIKFNVCTITILSLTLGCMKTFANLFFFVSYQVISEKRGPVLFFRRVGGVRFLNLL